MESGPSGIEDENYAIWTVRLKPDTTIGQG